MTGSGLFHSMGKDSNLCSALFRDLRKSSLVISLNLDLNDILWDVLEKLRKNCNILNVFKTIPKKLN